MQHNTQLVNLIKEKIKEQGKLSFAEFMELALYHPLWGYYTSAKEKIGPEGDYYTSPHVHPVFGYCVARQLQEMWQVSGCPSQFVLIEYGAGKGLLAEDIIQYLRSSNPDFFACLTYFIVEISPYHRQVQESRLAQLKVPEEKLSWVGDLHEINHGEAICGCVFSNELVDAFPVHRVILEQGELREIFVGTNQDSFYDVTGELSSPLLAEYVSKAQINLVEGQQVEVNLEAIRWLETISRYLEKGFVMTIDYGYQSKELEQPHRFDGTIMCYYHHKANPDPYRAIGWQDITAHVNFSALMNYGKTMGFKTAGLTNQMKFLVNLGIFDFMERETDAQERYQTGLAVKRLIMPDGMGERFRVLIQQKGVPSAPLTGLKGF